MQPWQSSLKPTEEDRQYFIQRVQRFAKGKKGKRFGDASFTRLGAKEELHVHLVVRLLMSRALNTIIQYVDQASNKAKKLVSSTMKEQYSLSKKTKTYVLDLNSSLIFLWHLENH